MDTPGPRLVQLTNLPVELLVDILEHVDGDPFEVQRTILAFSRALPYAPLPYRIFFEHVRLTQRKQVWQLYRRLRNNPDHAKLVKYFSYECFEADADNVVNLLEVLQDVEELTLWFGPHFAPEHLENIFERPRATLKRLFIRFRPYVQKASHVQFMRGSYFDSTLQLITKWPRASLPTFSLIQDPLDPKMASFLKFAQPIVFFHLNPITDLAGSPYLSTVTHLRFRVPARSITRYLSSHERSLPSVELLDVSGTSVSGVDLDVLLSRLIRLKYLVMDGCPIVSQRVDALEAEGAEALQQWASLGKIMAGATHTRVKRMEKQYKTWADQVCPRPEPAASGRSKQAKAKRGRRGVAAATISLREKPREEPPRPPGPSATPLAESDIPPVDKLRIIPPDLPLKHISITAPMVAITGEHFEENATKVREELERGWADGMRMLGMVRQRLQSAWLNGSPVYRFVVPEHMRFGEEEETTPSIEKDLFRFLELVDDSSAFKWTPPPCPVLCLAGPARNEHHPEGCPHRLGWTVWRDEM